MKKRKHFTSQQKLTIVTEVLQGRITKEAARAKYGIPGNCSILYWMRHFAGIKNYREPIKELSLNAVSLEKNNKISELESQLELLKKQLAYERLKSQALENLVTLAEEQLKINIRKNSGAKQSKLPGKRTKQ